jgi:hypothetical protein
MTGRIAIFAALIALVAQTQAATRYVSHSGNNTFPYTTWETAANTIEAANLATLPGDTMFVDTGSFYLSATVYTQPNITMRGKGMDSTTVLGSNTPELLQSVMFLPEDSNRVEDLRFVGFGSHYAFIKFATDPDRSLFFRSCKFSDFASSSLACGNNRYVTVTNCYFETWNDYALFFTDRGDYTVENNTFYMPDAINEFANFIGNTGTIILHKNIFVGGGFAGLQGGSGTLDACNNIFYHNKWLTPAVITGTRDIVFAQNTIVLRLDIGHSSNDALMAYGNRLEQCLIYNNIFAGVRPRILFINSPPERPAIKVAYNCFYSTRPFRQDEYVAAIAWEGLPLEIDSIYGNVYADPMLVDDWNGDLRLQQGSPCIDAGAPWILDVDGTRSDIGAFGGPDGEFYVYQDLAPAAPLKFRSWREKRGVIIEWQRNTESDLDHYALFRGSGVAPALDSTHLLGYFNGSGKIIGGPAFPNHRTMLGFSDTGKHVDPYEVIMPYADSTIWTTYFCDYWAAPESSYYYTLVAVDSSGLVSNASTANVNPPQAVGHPDISGVGTPFPTPVPHPQGWDIPDSASLEPNYPNPFNATTAIVYSLPNIGAQPAPVRLAIYNILGQEIKSLTDERQQPGRHIVYWDGTDHYGQPVASGVYLYRLEVSGIEFVKSGKMILMK